MEVLFSFGTWKGYPFQRGYIIINAVDVQTAIKEFRNHYPDFNSGRLNCCDIYTDDARISEFKENGNLGVGCHQYIDMSQNLSLEKIQKLLDDRECIDTPESQTSKSAALHTVKADDQPKTKHNRNREVR